MLNGSFLLDDFQLTGNDVEEFEALIKEIDAHTSHLKRSFKSFTVISIKEEEYQTDPKLMAGWYLKPEDPSNGGKKLLSCNVPKNAELVDPQLKHLTEETISANPTMILDGEGDSVYFLSNSALNTLAQRINTTVGTLREHSLERDLFIAKKMYIDAGTTLVVKHYRQIGKIFAMMGEDYKHVPLNEVCNVYKELVGENKLGKIQCKHWEVQHDFVRVRFAFPEYAEEVNTLYELSQPLTPCIEIVTSDTGESSFIVRGYWETENGGIIYDNMVKKEHKGNIEAATITRMVNESIFDKFNVLPERLVELMSIDITPTNIKLDSNRGGTKNRKAVFEAFKYVLKKLELVKLLSKKRVLSLECSIDFNLIEAEQYYTAYDVVMDVVSLASSLKTYLMCEEDISAETTRKVTEQLSKAPYVDFSKMTKKEPNEVFLVQ